MMSESQMSLLDYAYTMQHNSEKNSRSSVLQNHVLNVDMSL